MIRRTTDAALINAILNHPDVRPDVADMGQGEIDISAAVGDPANVCLIGEYGAFVCFKFYEGCYEVHTQILPEGRGEWAVGFAKAGAKFMFTATDCVEILTRTPQGHIAAVALTRAMGFRQQFVTPPECLFRGQRVPAAIWSLTIQDWALRQDHMAEEGARFHGWMGQRIDGVPHEPDPDHNRVVGISLAMIAGGQTAKAVVWYNRWAFAARHQPIRLLSLDPPRIAFDAGVLVLQDGRVVLE
jgi:hypothetical protein